MWTLLQRKRRELRYRQMVAPHVPHLIRVATQRTGDRALAEDLVQESCLEAWRHLDDLRTADAARAWLVRIVLRQIADHTRTRARRQRLLPITDLENAHWASLASDDPGPLERTLAGLADERIAGMLRELPPDFAVVVELRDIEDYRYREIAEMLEIPVGTVMSRLSRGRRLLAALLVEPQHLDAPCQASENSERVLP
ncbi:RNA polymerase sigma factor [Salinisphaera hydrothermalis]|uniref:RNA polymerase sigma factor n=1 Tax=Salinisphaera hydrothermalis TaxID=563188 RepID=UPI0033413FF2